MRPAAFLFGVIALGASAAGAYELARLGVTRFEATTRAEMAKALASAGQAWAGVETDGLIVALTGEAPDEAARVRALGAARALVNEDRIDDRVTVKAADPVAAPDFSLEILRDDQEVSLIGLVPEQGGRAAIRAGLDGAGLGGTISDMLQTTDQPMPAGWTDSVALGLRALKEAPRSKVSISPGHVRVTAAVENEEARRVLETTLRGARPRNVMLTLDITAPRPVISPFHVDFVADGKTGRFEACSAESVADVVEMSVAARRLGLAADPDCAIGLGAPSPDWAKAVAQGLEALRDLGGGRFAITDVAATLTGPAGVDPAKLTDVGARLGHALPGVFALDIVAPPRMTTDADGAEVYAPRFDAELTPEGKLRLGGALQNATSREAIESYATALVGHDRVENATVIDPALPDGWPSRVLVGVGALAELRKGTLEVTPDLVTLRGEGADQGTNTRVKALLAEKLGPGGGVADLTVMPAPTPPPPPAAVPAVATPAPTPAVAPAAGDAEAASHCAEEVTAILGSAQIDFAPASDAIDPESHGTILAIADALRACPRGRFEVGGHTDAQGSAEGNLQLSQRRAEAVVAALGAEIPASLTLTAKGYGEEDPVADNATAAGRGQNRRITFLVTAGGATDPAPATTETGQTQPPGVVAPLPEEGSGDEVQ